MNKKPLEVRVDGKLFRQVFGTARAFFVFPGDSMPKIVLSDNDVLPVVNIYKRIGPFKLSQVSLRNNLLTPEEAVSNFIRKAMQENSEAKDMNGIYVLDSQRYASGIPIDGKKTAREIEYLRFELVRYGLTDKALLISTDVNKVFQNI